MRSTWTARARSTFAAWDTHISKRDVGHPALFKFVAEEQQVSKSASPSRSKELRGLQRIDFQKTLACDTLKIAP